MAEIERHWKSVLSLPAVLAPNGLAAPFEVAPQPLDQQFPDDDGRHHPGGQAGLGRDAQQVDEGPADDHLVDQRVELAADRGPLVEQAGEVAVEGVGQGGDDEDRPARRPVPSVRHQGEDDHRQAQPAEGQEFGTFQNASTRAGRPGGPASWRPSGLPSTVAPDGPATGVASIEDGERRARLLPRPGPGLPLPGRGRPSGRAIRS